MLLACLTVPLAAVDMLYVRHIRQTYNHLLTGSYLAQKAALRYAMDVAAVDQHNL